MAHTSDGQAAWPPLAFAVLSLRGWNVVDDKADEIVGGCRVRGGGEGATAHCQKLWPQGGPHRKGGRESETGKKPHEELASETAKDRKWESPWRAHDVGGEEDCRKTCTWPGSNWRPSACEADVIVTRPQVLDCARLFCREMKNHCEGQGREGGGSSAHQ